MLRWATDIARGLAYLHPNVSTVPLCAWSGRYPSLPFLACSYVSPPSVLYIHTHRIKTMSWCLHITPCLHVHTQIMHRDLKPSNVLLDHAGVAKISE